MQHTAHAFSAQHIPPRCFSMLHMPYFCGLHSDHKHGSFICNSAASIRCMSRQSRLLEAYYGGKH